MADEIVWSVEEIPDTDSVLMRAHRSHFQRGDLMPGVFRDRDGDGMSVNWDKYASPQETRDQARKDPDHNAVIRMPVGGIRKIEDLSVEHSPQSGNRAHADVLGLPSDHEQLTTVRVRLLRIARIVIPV